MTRKRVVVVLVVVAVAALAIAGPGHVASLAIVIAAAFLAVVTLGVVQGVRAGIAQEREESGKEPTADER